MICPSPLCLKQGHVDIRTTQVEWTGSKTYYQSVELRSGSISAVRTLGAVGRLYVGRFYSSNHFACNRPGIALNLGSANSLVNFQKGRRWIVLAAFKAQNTVRMETPLDKPGCEYRWRQW